MSDIKEYEVTVYETLKHTFIIEASNPDEAMEKALAYEEYPIESETIDNKPDLVIEMDN